MAEVSKKEAERKEQLRHKIREQTIGYITAALGLVAGLAWNDAVRSTIDQIYPAAKGNNLLPKFWYAVVITLIVVIISYYLLRLAQSSADEEK
jgi:predicted ABC-type sugar transport system permease subunit